MGGAVAGGMRLRERGWETLMRFDVEGGAAMLKRGSGAGEVLGVRFFEGLRMRAAFWGGVRVSWPWWVTMWVR